MRNGANRGTFYLIFIMHIMEIEHSLSNNKLSYSFQKEKTSCQMHLLEEKRQ